MSKVKLSTIDKVALQDPEKAEKLRVRRKSFFQIRNAARKKKRGWL